MQPEAVERFMELVHGPVAHDETGEEAAHSTEQAPGSWP
jgi:hypothetical protein